MGVGAAAVVDFRAEVQVAAGKKIHRLVDDFKAEVEKEIALAEKNTSIEFVAHVSERSSDYRSWFWLSLLVPALIDYFLLTQTWFALSFSSGSAITVVFAVWILGVVFGDWHVCLVPSREKHIKVETRAKLAFLEHEVFLTQKRTGILIYLSLLEKSVFVLADRGFEKYVKSEEWAKLGQDLAKDFHHKNPGKTFVQALHALVMRLTPDFPPDNNSNELKDSIRFSK